MYHITLSEADFESLRKEMKELDQNRQEWWNDLQESSKTLATELKIEMFDVLTDEQWDRFQKLVDDPPDYIKKIIDQMRNRFERRTDNNPSATSAGTWQPGPDSWRPGDPIPEQYRQQRNQRSRFARETEKKE